ncbi:glutathione synthase [Candidatus Pantoea carbekii]|uniref:Glutathione synthetase n=1 Tax=Candidatus Pantoea carbekii TaxID=1235990 RepID=U3U5Y3_9GAMM|nr:glutathione synthase [Candidatus Pantoea carbekii]AKC32566.1 glutathione synthetase GshB [Candidatus Pantoea carbekii]BAO00300.1 GshB protein [Candidatus Pantoea carbekii]
MIKLGIIMDPISSINIKKDTSFAILLKAQEHGYEIHYMEIDDLFLHNGIAYGHTRTLRVKNDCEQWYQFYNEQDIKLSNLNVILMRKDPPFNAEFIYATYLLEYAEEQGTLIINTPQSLRNCNEKLYTAWFSDLTPHTLVTSKKEKLHAFWQQHGDIIIKPLDGMGGMSIFRIKQNDPNFGVITEVLTNHGQYFCIAQNYLKEIEEGDKRVLIVDGQPIPYCLARIPQGYETRGNLAVGGYGEARPLSESDWKIARRIAPIIKTKGIIFAGLDIIGNKLTEINITSPTCVCEIESVFPVSITGMLINAIEKRLMRH